VSNLGQSNWTPFGAIIEGCFLGYVLPLLVDRWKANFVISSEGTIVSEEHVQTQTAIQFGFQGAQH